MTPNQTLKEQEDATFENLKWASDLVQVVSYIAFVVFLWAFGIRAMETTMLEPPGPLGAALGAYSPVALMVFNRFAEAFFTAVCLVIVLFLAVPLLKYWTTFIDRKMHEKYPSLAQGAGEYFFWFVFVFFTALPTLAVAIAMQASLTIQGPQAVDIFK